ncbi:MAG TPA: queuosine precursor transporter [Chitinophagaceae bacterium]|nr:queuosine precursor transporter [Chitinophagaceae bacterium]
MTLLTAALITFAFVVFFFAIRLMPDTKYWLGSGVEFGVPDMQAAYKTIFGQGMNIIVGSLTAFILGQLIDAFVFRKIKVLTGEKNIWARATMSTIVSQFIDSVVVTYVAFTIFRGVPIGQSMAWAFTAYAYKFLVAIAFTPVIYLVHYFCERYLGIERAKEMKTAALRGY